MRIALCQFSAGEDKGKNLKGIRQWVSKAASQGADLVVFPEYAMHMSEQPGSAIRDAAEPLSGPFVEALCAAALEDEIAIICNVFEASHESRPLNTSVVIDRRGDVVGVYRKVHLYDAFGYQESANIIASPEPDPLVVRIGDFNIGVLICYDLRFPEWARAYVDRGADLLVYSAGWPPGPRKEDHWKTMLRSRAIENTAFVAGVVQGPPLATGGSILIDPMGGIEGELTDTDGLIVRDISPQQVEDVRHLNPSLKNRVFSSLIPAVDRA